MKLEQKLSWKKVDSESDKTPDTHIDLLVGPVLLFVVESNS